MNKLIKKIKENLQFFLKDPFFLRYWEDSWRVRKRSDNQLSASINSYWYKRRPYTYKGDAHMFVEDMYAGIMPFMHYRGEREKYPVRTTPQISSKQERMLVQGISGREHTFFLGDALCNFVRDTAHSLLIDGIVFYEIIYIQNERGEVESFHFEHIPPFYFFRFGRNYYQIVSWWEARKSRTRVQINKIPVEKVLRIDFSKELGGRKGLRRLLKRMWQLSKELIPEFQMQAMKENKNIGFDLEKFSKTKYFEVAKITKDFGWHQRQRSGSDILEYYSMTRFLRSKKIEAILRNLIISKLNEAIRRPPLRIEAEITIENLFSTEDVERQEKLMQKGDVAFMDVFNSLNI